MQQYKNFENKWKKELKAIRKQKKIIYSIAKKSGLRREIKKIRAKYSKKTSVSSINYWGSDSSLAIDSR